MASKGRLKAGRWEFVVKRAGVLEKPLYLYFTTQEEGIEYCRNLEALLARGIVPGHHEPPKVVMRLADLFAHYTRDAHPSQKDREVLAKVETDKGKTPIAALTIAWADAWVTQMKREERSAPSTIRAKVGATARAIDWARRKQLVELPENPLRGLPDGYARYTELDAKLAGVEREDIERDRRLEGDEEKRIRAVIAGGVIPRKLRPRPIPFPADLARDFTLAIETAMRLRERYTLEVAQVKLHQRTIYLDKTKNGDSRNVPLSSVAMAVLQAQIEGKQPSDRVFPWWDGDRSERGLKLASNFLSKLYAQVFATAGCPDLTEHDLRHEGTSRFFEKTRLRGEEIMRITGHRSHKMLMRYTQLRGSDLADKLWIHVLTIMASSCFGFSYEAFVHVALI